MTSEPPMSEAALPANTLAEAYLYLMALPCPRCGSGPLHSQPPHQFDRSRTPKIIRVDMCATCQSCDHEVNLSFEYPPPRESAADRLRGITRLNPNRQPSRILDVGQWLTLFRIILEKASTTSDRTEGRRLGYEAAQCLEEALKFYEPDNELPPASAFRHEMSKKRLRDHPALFARQRLLDMRTKLPSLTQMEAKITGQATAESRRPWWRFWRL